MKNLVPVSGNAHNFFCGIADSKHNPSRNNLQTLKPILLPVYQSYNDNFSKNTLEALSPEVFSGADSEELRNCYKNKTTRLNSLINQIRLNQPRHLQGNCQYCGIHDPDSMDHYLPQGEFAEFSVHCLNLLPCCRACNNLKLEQWRHNNSRTIINYYLDDLPSTEYLIANVDFFGDVPETEFSIDESQINSPKMRRRIISHYRILRLLDRYKRIAANEITQYGLSLKHFGHNLSKQEIRRAIFEDSASLRVYYGPNYWKAALVKALSLGNGFIDFAESLS